MTLREARCQFTRALASLIIHATALGFEVALDEATERLTAKDPTSDHMPNSLHHIGLAADLNLYRDGKYLSTSMDHRELGEWWEKLGDTLDLPLCWGGRFNDGNHYSLAWQGRK
jgi:hypothetical protein